MDLLSTVISQRNRSLNKFRYNFIEYKTSGGWIVDEVQKVKDLVHQGSIINTASQTARETSIKSTLLNAPDLSFRERERIEELKKKNKPLSADQKAGIQKYWLSHFYNQEVTAELIDLDDDGKTRERIKLLERVIDKKIKHTEYREIVDNPTLLIGLDIKFNDLKIVVFLRELFHQAGLFDMKSFTFRTDQVYGTSTLTDFINFLKQHEDRFGLVLEKSVNVHLSERPAHQLNTLLKMVGFKQISVKKNKGGNKGGATFKIDPDTYQSIMDIIDKRKKKRDTGNSQGNS